MTEVAPTIEYFDPFSAASKPAIRTLTAWLRPENKSSSYLNWPNKLLIDNFTKGYNDKSGTAGRI